MGLIELLAVSIALGSDAFSVAICIGMGGATPPQKLRLAAGFGSFQFLMPIVGIISGNALGHIFGHVAAYIGGALLISLGALMIIRTIRSGFHCPPFDHSSVLSLIAVSVGVSIDALAVGLGIGLSQVREVFTTCSVIGVTAFAMTTAGFEIGERVGKLVQNRSALLGGLILVAIGLRIIIKA
ncbi:MAG: manganese efflux pump MntP family protein [Armatimonadota bacterium]|nr:manganese efflux pump MntP family protein [Armatimonadota bacterium]